MRKLAAFMSVHEIKTRIGETLQIKTSNLGYIQPDHGWKGRQELLDSGEDKKAIYGRRRDMFLWCHLFVLVPSEMDVPKG